jgi:transposase InsO family protein
VELGDNVKYAVKEVVTASFQLESGKPLRMSDVLYVSGLKKNLLSISVMEDKGYAVAFSGGHVLAWSRGSSIDSAGVISVRDGGLYRLTGQPTRALVHDSDSLCKLWHKRLGHLHYRALLVLRKMVTGFPEFRAEQQGVCRGCALGKNAKATFSSSNSRSKGILDLVHSYVCEPMFVPSSSGYLYYVTFIDDYSRRTWIFFMKTKDEIFNRFREFGALVENRIGNKIKVLRSDNGGEYTPIELRDLCKKAGIKREMIVPFNPQQNGVAERKNRTIVEAARAMLHDQDLPMLLWAEACNTAVYVQNKNSHRILEEKTHKEAFTRVKPEIGHLRIFGCPVYIHVPKEKRTKLEPSGRKGMFMGYSKTSKAYRIYILGQQQIEVGRDVRFEEELAFKRSRETTVETDGEEREAPKVEESTGPSSTGV